MNHKKKPCPTCGTPTDPRYKCKVCPGPREYAAELGISMKKLRNLGGEAKVRAMNPNMRMILIPHHKVLPGGHPRYGAGGLAARGFLPGVPGKNRLIQPQVLGIPIDLALGEDDLG